MSSPRERLTSENSEHTVGSATRTVVSAQDARQGATGHNVRYVLGFGLAAVVIAFVAIYIGYFA
jgi:hypothetical protein